MWPDQNIDQFFSLSGQDLELIMNASLNNANNIRNIKMRLKCFCLTQYYPKTKRGLDWIL